ncbi:hypothetical protein [Sulfitobacter sp. MF3-043]|uniref:hypothetical protein n=1 Tax=Sulfitobacter sediminivivens TaxID=3252902 RepID=UPI0036DF05C3
MILLRSRLKRLATRLLDGGVPLARISVGRSILHPVIGLIWLQWDSDSGQVNVEHVPRSSIDTDTPKAPFADLHEGKCDVTQADLTDPTDVTRYSLSADLAQKGITGYFALNRRFGTS